MYLTVYTVCPDLSFQKLKNIMVTFKFAINNTIKTKSHYYTIFGHLNKNQNPEGYTFETTFYLQLRHFGIEKKKILLIPFSTYLCSFWEKKTAHSRQLNLR